MDEEIAEEIADAMDRIMRSLRDTGWHVQRDGDGDPLTIQVFDEECQHFIAISGQPGSEPDE